MSVERRSSGAQADRRPLLCPASACTLLLTLGCPLRHFALSSTAIQSNHSTFDGQRLDPQLQLLCVVCQLMRRLLVPSCSCGVCQFDGRLCGKLYPGEGRSEALIDMLRPLGLQFEVDWWPETTGAVAASG